MSPREPGGTTGDKLDRASVEMEDASDDMRETAKSLGEAAERVKTLEAVVRLGSVARADIEQLRVQVQAILDRITALEAKA